MQTLIETDVGTIKGETHPELGLVIHVDIDQWDVGAMRKAQDVFDEFVRTCQQHQLPAIFAGIPNDDLKNEKFALMFGFEKTEHLLQHPDGEYSLVVWMYPLEE